MSRSSRQGFSLMEVMIAVVILAIGLSSLFTSEAGAIKIAQRARTTTVATLLARCKMGEIEEKIAKEGWPGSALDGRDECCEDAEQEGFDCEWKVDRIVLPESSEAGSDEEAKAALDPNKSKDSQGTGSGNVPGSPATGSTSAEPGATMGIPLTGLPPILGGSGDPAGGMSSAGGGGGDFLASTVMQFTFPIMKPIIEEQVRRVTVLVKWKEGVAEQSFEVMQFLVNELPMELVPTVDEEAEQGTQPGTPANPANPTNPTNPPPGGLPPTPGGGR